MTVNESTLPAELDVVHLPVHRGRCPCGFAWIQRGFGQLHVSTRNSFQIPFLFTLQAQAQTLMYISYTDKFHFDIYTQMITWMFTVVTFI